MSDTTPTPLEPEQLDDLLSAALDGELESAALELGMSGEAAEARIRATPGADERRNAIASARDLLRVAPPMDELLAARLRAKAVHTAETAHAVRADDRRRKRNRIALSVGGIAAAAAAIVAVAGGVHGFNPDSLSSNSKSSASPSTSKARVAAPASPNLAASGLGSFADTRSLAVAAAQREAADRALTQNRTKSESSAAFGTDNTASAPAPTTAPQPASAQSGAKSTDESLGANYNAADGTGATCAAPPQVPVRSAPVLRTNATLSGKPVVVLVYAGTNERIVVIEDTHCKLVNVQMFR